MHVRGSASASILPSPSLTFTNVEVGDTEGQPMMSVRRFAVTIELMPLIQGEISVISMKIEDPVVRVSVDDAGQIDWTIRGEASRTLEPDKVVLSGVEVTGGTLIYNDAGSGSSVTLTDVNATVEARSLAGPWRIEGSYTANGVPSQFQVSTGRRDDDGSIRVKADVTPGQWPIAIGADGTVVAHGAEGPSYTGTYNLSQIVPASVEGEDRPGDVTGWRSEGSFILNRDKLVIDKAVLSEGPLDRPSSLAGSMTLTLGESSRFFAVVQARQLDLDRSLGEGPKKPIEMSTAADEFVRWLRGIPVPGIAGTVRFNVPAIVVGGAIIQDVGFSASPEDHGWLIEDLHARLPGQATFSADGRLSTGEAVGFGGQVRLAVNQPATFAAWWRGKSEGGAGRRLSPFDLAGRATVTMSGVAVEDMTTTIGDATITGSVSWTMGKDSPLRTLRTNLEADRLDFVQIRALAELLGGRDMRDTSTVADSFQIKLAADELLIDDLTMHDVTVDAGFENGGLTVSGIEVGDIGGAHFVVTRGQIDNILGEPLGRLEAQLTAPTLAGLAGIVDRLAPDTPFARWLRKAAPSLAPTSVALIINSAMDQGRPETQLDIKGSAKATNFDLSLELAGVPAAWRKGEVDLSASLKSYDAAGVARQLLIDEADVAVEGGAQFRLVANGIPDNGMTTALNGSFGGLTLRAEGDTVVPEDAAPGFTGSFGVDAPDLAPLVRLVGLDVPGIEAGLPISVAGEATSAGLAASLDWQNGVIAGRQVSGTASLSSGPEGGLRIDSGSISLDQLDLGWVASLGLGFSPLPTAETEEPWSREPFGEPALRGVDASLDIDAERILVGERLQVLNGKVHLGLAENRIDFDVKSGNALGGTVVGGFSVRNVAGNASLTGNVSLVGGALDTVVWQRAGRSVATGTLDLSGSFEATGRSPAGMIASLTGGGTLAIHDGEARYLNPKAGVLVIRDSDLGQEFTEDALRDNFGSYIDNGTLTFPEVEAPFAIAAGTIRFQNIAIAAAETRAAGSAAIDLNTMTLDSDWTLTLDSGDDRYGGDIPPQVGVVFRGPLATPERILDVLQFNSYLNIRQEARLQEILALEEQARLENAFFNRIKRKLREDEERAARIAEEARQMRVASATNLEALHAAREIAAAKKAEDELLAWWTVAAQAAADKEAAEAAAADAAALADAARTTANEADATVAAVADAARNASEAVKVAATRADTAEAARKQAEADVAAARAALDQATADSTAASTALDEATAALDAATAERSAATTESEASGANLDAAREKAQEMAARADIARSAADEAARAAEVSATALADLESELVRATTALDAATAEATAASQIADALKRKADEARDGIAGVKPVADEAEERAANADAGSAEAEAALAVAEARLDVAREAHRQALSSLAQAEAMVDADRQAADAANRAANAARAQADQARAAIPDAPLIVPSEIEKLETAALAAEQRATELVNAAVESGKAFAAARDELRTRAADLTAAESALTDARSALADAAAAAKAARAEADRTAQAVRAAEIEASTATDVADAKAGEAEAALGLADQRRAERDAIAAHVDAARAAAEQAATVAADAAATADAATAEATAAQAAAATATRDTETAAGNLDAATAAIATATVGLDRARTARDAVAQALTEAEARVEAAVAALDSATTAADAAKQTFDEGLAALDAARETLRAALAAADAARKDADTAEAAARDAAERAADLPSGWRPRSEDRAEAPTPTPVVATSDDIAAAAPAVAPAPFAIEQDESEATIELVPPTVLPRIRPSRPTDGASTANTGELDLALPTDGRPLTIRQP
ncbi:MAG: hypothetical protein KDK07_13785 [Bauldia sp.]|nr:hypothetical protein [Bauldia sp.]